jgi:hypothetical protein
MAAPVITAVQVSAIETFSADLEFTLTGAGTYSVAVMLASEDAPTAVDVMAGTATPTVFELVGSTVVSGKNEHVIIDGMSGNTAYIAYIASEDDSEDTSIADSGSFTTAFSIPNPGINSMQTPHFMPNVI